MTAHLKNCDNISSGASVEAAGAEDKRNLWSFSVPCGFPLRQADCRVCVTEDLTSDIATMTSDLDDMTQISRRRQTCWLKPG